jgi:nucleoid-associated protein YgaU
MVLVIPPAVANPREYSDEKPAGGSLVPITPGSWKRGQTTESSPRNYRVRSEDTLVDIAKQFYGDGTRFQELFDANRDVLASPDQLREGLMLVIP